MHIYIYIITILARIIQYIRMISYIYSAILYLCQTLTVICNSLQSLVLPVPAVLTYYSCILFTIFILFNLKNNIYCIFWVCERINLYNHLFLCRFVWLHSCAMCVCVCVCVFNIYISVFEYLFKIVSSMSVHTVVLTSTTALHTDIIFL